MRTFLLYVSKASHVQHPQDLFFIVLHYMLCHYIWFQPVPVSYSSGKQVWSGFREWIYWKTLNVYCDNNALATQYTWNNSLTIPDDSRVMTTIYFTSWVHVPMSKWDFDTSKVAGTCFQCHWEIPSSLWLIKSVRKLISTRWSNDEWVFWPMTSHGQACTDGTVRFAQIYPTVSPPLMSASTDRCFAIPYMVKEAWLIGNSLWRHRFAGLYLRDWTGWLAFCKLRTLFLYFLVRRVVPDISN